MPGELMAAEMEEQPTVVAALVDRRAETLVRLRRGLPSGIRGVVMLARGSSDNAAIYGRYLIERATATPVTLAAPSLQTLYGVRFELDGWLAIALSQSGRTPEIVDVAGRLGESGAHVIGVTNDSGSPLADACHDLVTLGAGVERAVPATKTFTAQLVAMATIATAIGGDVATEDDWHRLPAAVRDVLDDSEVVRDRSGSLLGSAGALVVGRGFLLSVALETALKLKECAGVLAQGYSTADLRHGPITLAERAFPVIVLTADGPTAADTSELVADLRERGANVAEVGQRQGVDVTVPREVPEVLVPVVAAVRGQQLALETARVLGRDPDRPEGLEKVTRTH